MASSSSSTYETSENGAKRRRIAVEQAGFKRLWLLPNEIWTDTFKLFSRRELLSCIQPSCRRFHTICENHVLTLHVVRRFDPFSTPLEQEALAHLTGSDISLAKHIQIAGSVEIHANIQNEMRLLRHSLELFHGCQIQMRLAAEFYRKDPSVLADLLALIKSMRPWNIEILTQFLESDQLLLDPLVMDCPRLSLHEELCHLPRVSTICQWLHHLPAAGEQESNATTRLFYLNWWNLMMPHKLYELVDRCREIQSQAKSSTDRRSFMLIFRWCDEDSRPGSRLELGQHMNQLTGEVLSLEGRRLNMEGGYLFHYLLRRCLHSELDTSDNFLRDTLRDIFGTNITHATDEAYFAHLQGPTKEGMKVPVPRLKLVKMHGYINGEEALGRAGEGSN